MPSDRAPFGATINRALVDVGIYADGIAVARCTREDPFLDLTGDAEAPAAA